MNAYVPHGGGPPDLHRCAGEALADRILVVFASLAARRGSFELPAPDLEPAPGGLVPLPRDGLRMIFRAEASAPGSVLHERRPGAMTALKAEAMLAYADLEPWMRRCGEGVRRAVASAASGAPRD